MQNAELYITRCIELARLGAGQVAPNPMVGCVIVHNGVIIGEGWHKKYGEAHAEVNAIVAVKDKSLLKASTLYVNLEPCCHFGKTPPCADLIIQHQIPNVVVGMKDPNELVAGKGIERLIAAGVNVTVGVAEKQCIELNKRFITYVTHKRPYVILKWAQTSDGFIAPDKSKLTDAEFENKRHITGLVVQQLVHQWRSEEDAILVGRRTIETDNPSLNIRAWIGRNPLRITLDKDLKLNSTFKFFDRTQPSLVFTHAKVDQHDAANLTYVTIDFEKPIWPQILAYLYSKSIQSLIIEGGTHTLQSVIDGNYWDEAQVFTNPFRLMSGVKAPDFTAQLHQQFEVDGSQLILYRNV